MLPDTVTWAIVHMLCCTAAAGSHLQLWQVRRRWPCVQRVHKLSSIICSPGMADRRMQRKGLQCGELEGCML